MDTREGLSGKDNLSLRVCCTRTVYSPGKDNLWYVSTCRWFVSKVVWLTSVSERAARELREPHLIEALFYSE